MPKEGRSPSSEIRKKVRKPKRLKISPLSFWAVDLIERVRDGIRRYILTLVDPKSRIAFAVALPSKHSRNTAEVLKALLSVNPTCKGLLSDNGSNLRGILKLCSEIQNHPLLDLPQISKDECT